MRSCVIAYFMAAFCIAMGIHEAVVEFNTRGVTGTIVFTEINETSVRVNVSLQGLVGDQGWHVHKLPVDQTVNPAVQCLNSWVGGHYDPTDAISNPNYDIDCNPSNQTACEYGDLAGRLGLIPSSGELVGDDTSGQLQLEGLFSIVGRSVVIHEPAADGGVNFECGTIRLREELEGAEVVILQSILVSPVAGRIYFKQVYGVGDVQVWGKLYYVNDSAATMDHNWHIHRDIGVEDYRIGSCGKTGPHYDPLNMNASSPNYLQRCTPETPTMCEIGDLTGKLDTVNVAASPRPHSNEAFFFTDTYLNLTGSVYPVVNRAIVIHVPDRGAPRTSCAPLVMAENITLEAFSTRSSYATFNQYSRFQQTTVSFGTLPGNGNNDLTVVTAAFNPNTACPDDSEGIPSDSTYSPYDLFVPMGNAQRTPDTYALGDLTSSYRDYVVSGGYLSARDLPLSGAVTTVSGRTLRFTYANNRECGALLPTLAEGYEFTSAKASFSGALGGAIYFLQYRGEDDVVTGSTFIMVDIYYVDGDADRTMGHNWRVYTTGPSAGPTTCPTSLGGTYNPYDVSMDSPGTYSNYSAECNGNYPLRCAKGDLGSKHGPLDIGSISMNSRPTYTYTDNNLELGGSFSILNRPLGIRSSDGSSLVDCAVVEFTVISEYYVYTSVPADSDMTRVQLAESLTDGITAADDVVVVNQYVDADSGCVMSTLQVMGPDAETLNRNMGRICSVASESYNSCPEGQEEVDACPGFQLTGGAVSVTTSHFLLSSLLLITVLSLMLL